jgi:hypothetical protein
LGAKESVPKIVELLKDSAYIVRTDAASALGKLGARETAPAIVKLLRDPSADVRNGAAWALRNLRARESVPELIELLTDSDKHVRNTAASALCTLGSKDGVPILLEDRDLFFLNALRRPEIWERLESITWQANRRESRKEVLERTSRKAEMRIESEETDDPWYHSQRAPLMGRITPIQALVAVLGGKYQAVLEKDRIRIMSRDESIKFWTTWWEGERNK